MACPLCNDTGDQRYWEGRWRDADAENAKLRVALKTITETMTPGLCGENLREIAYRALKD